MSLFQRHTTHLGAARQVRPAENIDAFVARRFQPTLRFGPVGRVESRTMPAPHPGDPETARGVYVIFGVRPLLVARAWGTGHIWDEHIGHARRTARVQETRRVPCSNESRAERRSAGQCSPHL